MICHWTQQSEPFAHIATSCGAMWGLDRIATYKVCPDCDCDVKVGGDAPQELATKRKRVFTPDGPKRAECIADIKHSLDFKLAESYRIASETKTEMVWRKECPVPRGCNGPHIAYYKHDFATYEAATFGTIPCRFHCDTCSYQVRENNRIAKQREAEQNRTRNAKTK